MLEVREIEAALAALMDSGEWTTMQWAVASAILQELRNGAALSYAYDSARRLSMECNKERESAAVTYVADLWVLLTIPTTV